MKISKWLSLLMAVTMLPLNALAVTEGVVEQAPDVNLSTYTEWAAQSADAYLPDAAMYANLMPLNVPANPTLVPGPTVTLMPDAVVITEISEQEINWTKVQPTPMPEDVLPQPTITPMLSPEPSPMPDDVLTATDTQDMNWHMVPPTPTPAPGYPVSFDFILPAGRLFTLGEQDRIKHIIAERAKGFVRHPDNSDMVVLMPSDVLQTATAASDQPEINNKWSVSCTDGSHVQTQQTDAALTVPGDMALCQINPDDFDGESWYLMLPARELTEDELLAVFDAFDLINQPFDPDAINIRNCCRGLAYNRALRTEEIERLDRLNQLVRNDLIPQNINFDSSRNLVICCVTGERLFLRPYSSMKDEELLQEINISNQDADREAINKTAERKAREMLNRYFGFPLSMACAGYIYGRDTLVVETILKEDHQIMMKHIDNVIGAEFKLSEDADSLIFVDVCFDDVPEGRMIYVKYVNIPKVEYDAASVYRIETADKYPELYAAADRFAKRYFGKYSLQEWYQATDDRQQILPHTVLPVKPYMILYTFTDEAVFSMTVEEDGVVREANVHFFNDSADLMREIAEHPKQYIRLEDVLAELDT